MVDKLGVHFANMFPKHVLPFIIVGKLVDNNHIPCYDFMTAKDFAEKVMFFQSRCHVEGRQWT